MSTFLVTGVGGFIGSSLARELVKLKHRVIGVDDFSTGHLGNVPDEVEFIEGNCKDSSTITDLNKIQFDTIFHLAGQSSGEISFADPIRDLESNVVSTLQLLKMAEPSACSRFIYASSMSVYGNCPTDRPVSENMETNPLSFYGIGKRTSEQYLQLFSRGGMHTTSLRLFNVYGPGQDLTNMKQGMLSIYLSQMLKNNMIMVKGNLTRSRDFRYIDDVVEAFLSCLKGNHPGGQEYNIGTGKGTTVNKVLELLKSQHFQSVKVATTGGTPGDQNNIYADITKANQAFGFKAKTTISEGLKKTYRWVISNNKDLYSD